MNNSIDNEQNNQKSFFSSQIPHDVEEQKEFILNKVALHDPTVYYAISLWNAKQITWEQAMQFLVIKLVSDKDELKQALVNLDRFANPTIIMCNGTNNQTE